MKSKERKPIFFKSLSIVLVILLLNAIYLLYYSGNFSNGFTGFSVKDTFFESYFSLPHSYKLFLVGQWTFLLILILFAFLNDVRIGKSKVETITFNVKRNSEQNKTDLDILYDILKDKKELSISSIAESFNVTKEVATEWCKILESGELALIDYPSFSEPMVRIKEGGIESSDAVKRNKNTDIVKNDIVKESYKIKNEISKPFSNKNLKIR